MQLGRELPIDSQATVDEVASEELVAPVLARGAVYVPTPEEN